MRLNAIVAGSKASSQSTSTRDRARTKLKQEMNDFTSNHLIKIAKSQFWEDITSTISHLDSNAITAVPGKKDINFVGPIGVASIDRKTLKKLFIIDPLSQSKLIWDFLIALIVLFSVLTIPFVIAFDIDVYDSLEYSIDVLFFIDMVISFNTAYSDRSTELLITDRKKIAIEYFRFWFWIDSLSTIPFDTLLTLAITTTSTNSSKSVLFTQLIKVFRLLRIVKLFRFLKLNKIVQNLENSDINQTFINTQFLLFRILFVCHLIACFWFMMSSVNPPQPDDTNWVEKFNFKDSSRIDQYIASFYWTTTTLLSIGYGDIYAVNRNERIYAICTQIFGGIIFGAVIAQVTQIMDKRNPTAKAFNDRMNELSAYLEEKVIPIEIKAVVKDAYSYYLRHKSCFPENAIVLDLPDHLREGLLKDVYSTEITHISLFSYLHIKTVLDIIIYLKPFKVKSKVQLIGQNDVMNEIVFIMKGLVVFTINYAEKSNIISGYDSEGGMFGSLGYFKRALSVGCHTAVTDCHFLSLQVRHLDIILNRHPEAYISFHEELGRKFDKYVESKNSLITSVIPHCFEKEKLLVDGEIYDHQQLPEGISRIHSEVRTYFSDQHKLTINATAATTATTNAMTTASTIILYYSHINLYLRRFYQNYIANNNNQTNLYSNHHTTTTTTTTKDRFLVHPKGPKKCIWDLFIGVLIIYSVLMIPIEIGFGMYISTSYFWFTFLVDMCFMSDMTVTANTSYYDIQLNKLIEDKAMIRMRYLKGWFWVDLLTSFPIDFTLYFIEISSSSQLSASNNILKVLRLTRLMRLFRIIKLESWLIVLEEKLGYSSSIFLLLKLLGQVLFIGHSIACVWWWIGDLMSNEGDAWFDQYSYRDKSLDERYILSLYWTFTTLCTVGYGDILASNSSERIVNIFIQLIGASLFGYTVAHVSYLVNHLDASAAKIQLHIDEIKHYLDEKQTIKPIHTAIIRHSVEKYKHVSIFDEITILSGLPDNLVNLLLTLRHEDALQIISIFHYIPNKSIILHIFRRMELLCFESGRFIIRQDEEAQKIFFLIKGTGHVLISMMSELSEFVSKTHRGSVIRTKNNITKIKTNANKIIELKDFEDFKVIDEVKMGDFFGHIGILKKRHHEVSIRATSLCTTYSLSLDEIYLLCEDAKAINIALRIAFAKAIHFQRKRFEKSTAHSKEKKFLKTLHTQHREVKKKKKKKKSVSTNQKENPNLISGGQSRISNFVNINRLGSFVFSGKKSSNENSPSQHRSDKHGSRKLKKKVLHPQQSMASTMEDDSCFDTSIHSSERISHQTSFSTNEFEYFNNMFRHPHLIPATGGNGDGSSGNMDTDHKHNEKHPRSPLEDRNNSDISRSDKNVTKIAFIDDDLPPPAPPPSQSPPTSPSPIVGIASTPPPLTSPKLPSAYIPYPILEHAEEEEDLTIDQPPSLQSDPHHPSDLSSHFDSPSTDDTNNKFVESHALTVPISTSDHPENLQIKLSSESTLLFPLDEQTNKAYVTNETSKRIIFDNSQNSSDNIDLSEYKQNIEHHRYSPTIQASHQNQINNREGVGKGGQTQLHTSISNQQTFSDTNTTSRSFTSVAAAVDDNNNTSTSTFQRMLGGGYSTRRTSSPLTALPHSLDSPPPPITKQEKNDHDYDHYFASITTLRSIGINRRRRSSARSIPPPNQQLSSKWCIIRFALYQQNNNNNDNHNDLYTHLNTKQKLKISEGWTVLLHEYHRENIGRQHSLLHSPTPTITTSRANSSNLDVELSFYGVVKKAAKLKKQKNMLLNSLLLDYDEDNDKLEQERVSDKKFAKLLRRNSSPDMSCGLSTTMIELPKTSSRSLNVTRRQSFPSLENIGWKISSKWAYF